MTESATKAEAERSLAIPETEFFSVETARRRSATRALISRFLGAFNAQDKEALLTLVSEDVVLDYHPQRREWGRDALDAFLRRGESHFREHVFDIEIMTNTDGTRGAAEYTVLGVPLCEDERAKASSPQSYRFEGGLFVEILGDRITRLSTLRHRPGFPESLF